MASLPDPHEPFSRRKLLKSAAALAPLAFGLDNTTRMPRRSIPPNGGTDPFPDPVARQERQP